MYGQRTSVSGGILVPKRAREAIGGVRCKEILRPSNFLCKKIAGFPQYMNRD